MPTEGALPKLPGHPGFPYDFTDGVQPESPSLVERTVLKARSWITYAFPGWGNDIVKESGVKAEE
jgi:hypothetical protein